MAPLYFKLPTNQLMKIPKTHCLGELRKRNAMVPIDRPSPIPHKQRYRSYFCLKLPILVRLGLADLQICIPAAAFLPQASRLVEHSQHLEYIRPVHQEDDAEHQVAGLDGQGAHRNNLMVAGLLRSACNDTAQQMAQTTRMRGTSYCAPGVAGSETGFALGTHARRSPPLASRPAPWPAQHRASLVSSPSPIPPLPLSPLRAAVNLRL